MEKNTCHTCALLTDWLVLLFLPTPLKLSLPEKYADWKWRGRVRVTSRKAAFKLYFLEHQHPRKHFGDSLRNMVLVIFSLVVGLNRATWVAVGLDNFRGVLQRFHHLQVLESCLFKRWMSGERNSFCVAVLDKVIEISKQFITLKLYASKMSRNGNRMNEEGRRICRPRRAHWVWRFKISKSWKSIPWTPST